MAQAWQRQYARPRGGEASSAGESAIPSWHKHTRAGEKFYGREEEFVFELRQPRDANYQTYLILGTEPSSLSAAALMVFVTPTRARCGLTVCTVAGCAEDARKK